MAGRSWADIVSLTRQMQDERGITINRMRSVLERYDGDYVIPLPDLPNEPDLPLLTPMLVGELVDTMAMRAASVYPKVTSPAIDRNRERGVRSQEYADIRAGALESTLFESLWPLARRRYYRHISAYQTFSLVVTRDDDAKQPRIRVRDPLTTFAEHRSFEEMRPPRYVAFITTRSAADLRATFPQARQENGGPIATESRTDMLWDVLEWFDEDQTVFGILGPTYDAEMRTYERNASRESHIQIGPAIPNRIGLVPVVCPESPSLGKIASRIASLTGVIDLQARLMALDAVAQEKATFPDVYVISAENQVPRLDGGHWKDGRDGEVNLVSGAQTIGVLRTTADPQTGVLVDKLERSVRASTGAMSQMSGETRSNLRTGRAMDTLAGIALDPRIQEMHELSQLWLPQLNTVMLETYKTFWPGRTYSMYTGHYGDKSLVEFTPSKHIETTKTSVSYPVPGADIIQLTQIVGSLAGAKGISTVTMREMHPWIKNAAYESQQIREEELDEAMLQSLMQQVASGQMPLVMMTAIRKAVGQGKSLTEAIDAGDKAMRDFQAAQAPPPGEGQIAAPEQMPGLAGGPPGVMQQGPAAPPGDVEVPGNVTRLRQLMNAMNAGG